MDTKKAPVAVQTSDQTACCKTFLLGQSCWLIIIYNMICNIYI